MYEILKSILTEVSFTILGGLFMGFVFGAYGMKKHYDYYLATQRNPNNGKINENDKNEWCNGKRK